MKIKQGISSLDEAEWFIDSGAGELYFGMQGLPSHVSDPASNISGSSAAQLKDISAYAHSKNCGIYAAVNDFNATGRISDIVDKMRFLMEYGIDGFIVSSPELVYAYPNTAIQPKWHLSVLAMCMNRASLAWYRNLGFSRFAAYQQLLPEELAELMKEPGFESEVFLSDEICVNHDGICRGCSGDIFGKGKFCEQTFTLQGGKKICLTKGKLKGREYAESFWKFFQIANWLKLVRKQTFEQRKAIFLFSKGLISLAEKCKSEEEFVSRAENISLRINPDEN